MRADAGTIASALLHLGLILWALLGDWLFAPKDAPELPVAEVSLISEAEFDALVASAPKPEETPAEPADTAPPPARPEPEPLPEPLPEDLPEAEIAQPDPAPEPEAPLAEEAQPIPVPADETPVAPRPIDRVADTPVNEETDAPELADTPTPEVSDAPEAEVVEEPPQEEASPEEATTQIVTEAVETEEEAPQLASTSSRRPQARPKREPPPEPEPEAEPAPETDTAAVEDALAEALAEEAATEPAPADPALPEGPPMTAGEKDALRVAVKKCWNLGALSSEAMRTTVTIYVALAQDGTPDLGSLRMIGAEGGDEASAQKMFEVARRAIARCGKDGFPLPADKYDQWRELELVFDPDGMRLR